jgi:hypothetical protein
MTEVRTSSLCERPCAGIEDTLEASIGIGGHQSVFDAAMAPTQESGLRENCTSRLSERAEAGRKLHLSRLYTAQTPTGSNYGKSKTAVGPRNALDRASSMNKYGRRPVRSLGPPF